MVKRAPMLPQCKSNCTARLQILGIKAAVLEQVSSQATGLKLTTIDMPLGSARGGSMSNKLSEDGDAGEVCAWSVQSCEQCGLLGR